MVLALFYELILIKLYTNVNNDNILDKLAFQRCSSKPSSRSQLHMAGAFITFSDFLVFYYFFYFCNSHISVPQEAQRNAFIVHTPGNESVFNPKLFFLNDTAAWSFHLMFA